MTGSKKSVVVLISGSGTNLQALIDSGIPIALVVSNKKNAYGLTRASNSSIPTLVLTLKAHKDAGKSRNDYDIHLAKEIKKLLPPPYLIVLAGFMHILSESFITEFDTIINLHPALPGQFDGTHAIRRAYEAFKAGQITTSGVMVHRVVPEVDKGEPLLTREVEFKEDDTLEAFEARMHATEHELIVQATKSLL
ncbi:hypothetical protein SeMB42_g05892 [Synchytrium endobioticum]|uniref:phosphoribosylglycinamide formyltransferase 1 n=1 Tax=Synchytrium endobioticum TaxID=286115 RepID=A0A507CNN4_9FUNG|nr:hypothetical protein SeMB42_g05892 [Synchytrium endobioticum]TPX50616.1 hypothetical protein SeLEV6574_g00777 [Synchytrium endobioticum]